MNRKISVLIGENGCGKSQILSDLVRSEITESSVVLAIATSVFDKFPRRNFSSNYHYTGSRLGKFIPRESIKKAITELNHKSSISFSSILKVLEYIGYDSSVGFKINNFNPFSYTEELFNDESIEHEEFNRIISIIITMHGERSDIVWAGDRDYSNINYDEALVDVLRYEKLLKKFKIIKSVDIFLSKKGHVFPLDRASSGELSLISTLIFISSYIKDDGLILIDEPENSLHPKWQKDYVSMIMDLFHYYSPKLIIATHSPTIISALSQEDSVDIHKFSGTKFELHRSNVKSAEEVYSEIFDVITPSNRSLSNDCAKLLNKVSELKMSIIEANKIIDDYLTKSYDEEQKLFLNGVKELIVKLS